MIRYVVMKVSHTLNKTVYLYWDNDWKWTEYLWEADFMDFNEAAEATKNYVANPVEVIPVEIRMLA